jgi:hypothetical protein
VQCKPVISLFRSRDWEDHGSDQPRQKVSETPLHQHLGVVTHACHLSYVGSINKRNAVQACLGKREDPIPKIKEKRLGVRVGIAEVLEALSSNHQKKKN